MWRAGAAAGAIPAVRGFCAAAPRPASGPTRLAHQVNVWAEAGNVGAVEAALSPILGSPGGLESLGVNETMAYNTGLKAVL